MWQASNRVPLEAVSRAGEHVAFAVHRRNWNAAVRADAIREASARKLRFERWYPFRHVTRKDTGITLTFKPAQYGSLKDYTLSASIRALQRSTKVTSRLGKVAPILPEAVGDEAPVDVEVLPMESNDLGVFVHRTDYREPALVVAPSVNTHCRDAVELANIHVCSAECCSVRIADSDVTRLRWNRDASERLAWA
jgi:hypothetical protein